MNAAAFNYSYPIIQKEVADLAAKNYEYFFTTDATAAFTQIPLEEESRKLLAFAVNTDKYRGTFCYNRLCFGFQSAPSIFASILDNILEGVNQPHARFKTTSFIDDISGGAATKEDMFKQLKILFGRLRRYNLKLSI